MLSCIQLFVASRLLCPWDFPGKNTGEDCHFLHQGIFPTPGSNPYLLSLRHCQADSLPPGQPGSQSKYIHPHFTDVETESQIGSMTCPEFYRRSKQILHLFLNLMPFSQIPLPFHNNVLKWTDHWRSIETIASPTLKDRNHLEQPCFDR